MYVVRKPFRNFGIMLLPGSKVEPGNIKRFKTRLKDRYIIAVTEDNIDNLDAYFKAKHGVSIKAHVEQPSTTPDVPKPAEVSEPVKKVVVATVKS